MRDLILMGLVVLAFLMPSDGGTIVNDQIIKDLENYVEISDKAYKDAESKILSNVDPDVPDFTEECDGNGWIVHGDGHKTPCPGCSKCGNGASGDTGSFELIQPDDEYIEEMFKDATLLEEKPEEQPKEEVSSKEPEKPVQQARHKCKCDTKSTVCKCIEKLGECRCNKR